ncbi:polyprenyl diphosphate synthase [Methanolacinia paynteri]|uniref:polyprenyl diphosphate synthase n=1 Tax=Methanolacinia paynteri TaxID=230356 RepID=UPI00064F9A19|nr:polyprenyl diphosphate synthase [Methanolacinia paynteri]
MRKPGQVLESFYERRILGQCRHIPDHIAIIQDGNRRYAKERGIDVAIGHRMGAEKTNMVLEWARDIGVRHLTLYCFSTENFNRSEYEQNELFKLFTEKAMETLEDERVHENRIRFQMVGDRDLVPEDLLKRIEKVEEVTKKYNNFTINLALAYGGRNEILHATKSILSDIEKGVLRPEDINEDMINAHLYHGMNIPPVDLIIRTGDDKRTSNFLPWLANGNESAVYFCAPYWPVFRKIDLLRGIRVFSNRVDSSYLP